MSEPFQQYEYAGGTVSKFAVLPPAPPHVHAPNNHPDAEPHGVWVPAQPGDTPGQADIIVKLNEILTMLDRLEPLITFAEQQVAKHNKLMGLIRR